MKSKLFSSTDKIISLFYTVVAAAMNEKASVLLF